MSIHFELVKRRPNLTALYEGIRLLGPRLNESFTII